MLKTDLIGFYFIYIAFIMYLVFLNYRKAKKLKIMNEVFLSYMHDIKNYSINIYSAGQFLLKKLDSEDNGALEKYLNIIINNNQEMNEMIKRFSMIMRNGKSNEEGQKEEELVNLVNQAVKLCTFYAKKKNVAIEVVSKWNIKYIKVDKNKFIRILTNLIMNGVKYSNEKGKITIHIYGNDNWIEIGVEDNGQGMNNNDMKKVFSKFYRVKRVKDSDDLSLGMGLYSSKKLAKSMGGNILVKSIEGKGSTFILKFPITNISRYQILKNIMGDKNKKNIFSNKMFKV